MAIITPTAELINEVKNDTKAAVISDENETTLNHIQTLVKQGNFLLLTQLQQVDATWKSYLYNLPKGTMKFLINASIDTLPTNVNLAQWGKRTNALCSLQCGKKETTNHILNCCQVALPRYLWRHNNVLSYILSCLDTQKYSVFSDIEGKQTSAGGTIPPNICVTTLIPDLVIINNSNKTIKLFELTVPGELRIEKANKLKFDKYQHFETTITSHQTSVVPFEIGSNTGLITSENKTRLTALHKYCKKEIKLKKFIQNISAIAGMGSFYIFNARKQVIWSEEAIISAPFSNQ